MDEVTLQPVAGAQGEFTAVRCIQEYFRERGEDQRTRIVVPDSAHGTNPASAAMAGSSRSRSFSCSARHSSRDRAITPVGSKD